MELDIGVEVWVGVAMVAQLHEVSKGHKLL